MVPTWYIVSQAGKFRSHLTPLHVDPWAPGSLNVVVFFFGARKAPRQKTRKLPQLQAKFSMACRREFLFPQAFVLDAAAT